MENKLRTFKLIDKDSWFSYHINNENLYNVFFSQDDVVTGNIEEGYLRRDKSIILLDPPEFIYFEEILQEEQEPSLMDEDSTQGQLSSIGDLLHNLSCSMENEDHQYLVGIMANRLWELSNEYRQNPEQKLRSKVWDVVAETDIS